MRSADVVFISAPNFGVASYWDNAFDCPYRAVFADAQTWLIGRACMCTGRIFFGASPTSVTTQLCKEGKPCVYFARWSNVRPICLYPDFQDEPTLEHAAGQPPLYHGWWDAGNAHRPHQLCPTAACLCCIQSRTSRAGPSALSSSSGICLKWKGASANRFCL